MLTFQYYEACFFTFYVPRVICAVIISSVTTSIHSIDIVRPTKDNHVRWG